MTTKEADKIEYQIDITCDAKDAAQFARTYPKAKVNRKQIMTTKNQALRIALDALTYKDTPLDEWSMTKSIKLDKEAIKAIREALAQPEQEPEAWQWIRTAHFRKCKPKDAQKGEWRPLYTSPPARKPLTEEHVLGALESRGVTVWGPSGEDFEAGVRFAEAAHGITGGEA